MKKIRCLIIDDEPIATEVIKNHLDKMDQLEIAGICDQAVQAFEFLKLHPVDLIFLDIQMPKMTGINFLKSLKNPPAVIIVSAYREYALEGFELDVVDYLLKPVSFERFLKAIDKYYTHYNKSNNSLGDEITAAPAQGSIWVRSDRKNVRIETGKIRYIEGLKDYLKIYLDEEMILSKITMKEMEEKLKEENFIRIHRSFLVPVKRISAYTQESVEVGKDALPIGYSYRNSVMAILKDN